MATIDPFVINRPAAFGKLPQEWTPEDVAQVQNYFEYLHRFLHDMWQALTDGTGQDSISAIENVITGEPDSALPSGEEPVWQEPDWQIFISS